MFVCILFFLYFPFFLSFSSFHSFCFVLFFIFLIVVSFFLFLSVYLSLFVCLFVFSFCLFLSFSLFLLSIHHHLSFLLYNYTNPTQDNHFYLCLSYKYELVLSSINNLKSQPFRFFVMILWFIYNFILLLQAT